MTHALPTNQAIAGERFALFDTLRFIAIVGIVWMHTVESPWGLRYQNIGRFGVPFFVMGSMLFMASGLQKRPELSWRRYLRTRVWRLYVPFLVWTAIYYGARLVKHRFFQTGSALELKWQSLYIGQAAHTWFLPFLLVVNVVGFWIVRAAQRHRRSSAPIAIVLLLITVALCVIPIPGVQDPPANHFLYCAWFALPSATLGLAIALSWPQIRGTVQTLPGLAGGIALCAVSLAVAVRSGRSVPIETLAGLGTFVVSLQPIRITSRIADTVGRHSFDIYLNHVLFIEAMQAVMKRMALPISIAGDLVIACAAIVLGLGLSVTTHSLLKTFKSRSNG